jgi:hypothetical protein
MLSSKSLDRPFDDSPCATYQSETYEVYELSSFTKRRRHGRDHNFWCGKGSDRLLVCRVVEKPGSAF